MKNRISCRLKKLGIVSFLMTGIILANCGENSQILAAGVDNSGIVLTQKAAWTDEVNGKAEITMEISGIKAYWNKLAEEAAAAEARMNAADNPSEIKNTDTIDSFETVNGEIAAVGAEKAEGTEAENSEAASADASSEAKGYTPEELLLEEVSADLEKQPETNPEYSEANAGYSEANAEYSETNPELSVELYSESAPEELPAQEDGVVFSARSGEIYLCNTISEYFAPDFALLPGNYQTEEIPVKDQKGERFSVTRIFIPVTPDAMAEDFLRLNIPIVLKDSYRITAEDRSYPTSYDQSGAGTTLLWKNSTETILLAQTASSSLTVKASEADFRLSLTADTANIKAGQTVTYEAVLENCGVLPLKNVQLNSVFSDAGFTGTWQEADGLKTEAGSSNAVLETLAQGETRHFFLTVEIPKEQQNAVLYTLSAAAEKPSQTQAILKREASIRTSVTPLRADFTVEKTADRTTAAPGDTITYQICIRNTGERTLHSVLSTERFLSAGVYAQFVEKEGVELNASKNQALISQIEPGQAFALEAVVTVPQTITSQNLINQVTVTTKETGSRTVQSQAGVGIQAQAPTITPWVSQSPYQTSALGKSSLASPASSYPKTSDESKIGFFAGLLGISALLSAGIHVYKKTKKKGV